MYAEEQHNIACEHVPFDWIGDIVLVQRYSALRLVSLLQLVYAILAYATTIAWGWSESKLVIGDYPTYLQAIGGISLLTIIAAIVMRLRLGGEKSLTQVKLYTGFMVVEILLWGGRLGYIVHVYIADNWDFPYQEFFVAIIPNFFVLILLLVGMSVGAKVIHRATTQQYSLLSDGVEDSPAFRSTVHFYPLRVVAFIQCVYAICGFVTVFATPDQPYDLGTSFLINPSAGAFTIISAILLIFAVRIGKSLLTYYAILQAIDMVTGLIRGAAGLLYIIIYINHGPSVDTLANHQLIVTTSIGTVFPIFYWIFGIVTAYRTRVQIEMDSHISSQDSEDTERVYGI